MGKGFQFRSLRARLTFWFMLLIIAPLIATDIMIYEHMALSRKEAVYDKLEAVRDLKVIELNNWLDDRTGDVRTLASDSEIRILEKVYPEKEKIIQQNTALITKARNLLKIYLKNHNSFNEILFISPHSGEIYISTNERNEGKYRSKDLYLAGALQKKELFIKEPLAKVFQIS